MINNFVLVSGVQQGDLVIHRHVPILFPIVFPFRLGSSDGKESTCNAGDLASITGSRSWSKILWRKEWLPTPVFLPGEFHGHRSLVGYSPWGQ